MILELENLMGGVVAQNVILDFKLSPGAAPGGRGPPPVLEGPDQSAEKRLGSVRRCRRAHHDQHGPLDTDAAGRGRFFSSRPLPLQSGVLFQVEDSGPGLPPEVIDRIFEPFVSTKAVGRGLGLATVFGIVDVHSGGIAITSEPDQGTCFRIWLPTAKPAGGAVPVNAAPCARTPVPGRTATARPDTAQGTAASCCPLVLLVEDDPAILRTTRIVLRSLGVEALTAASQRRREPCSASTPTRSACCCWMPRRAVSTTCAACFRSCG